MGSPLSVLSDLQSALFTLVFLASGSLPWVAAMHSGDRDAAIASMYGLCTSDVRSMYRVLLYYNSEGGLPFPHIFSSP